MAMVLVVVHTFGRYRVGDIIADESVMAEVARGEHGNRTVRVEAVASTNDQIEEN